jgi:cytidylate kinase
VLPDAPVKIFLTASLDARVARRLAELAERGTPVDPAELRAQLAERDALDESRPVAPLRPSPEAEVIDSTDLTVDQVVGRIAARVLGPGA